MTYTLKWSRAGQYSFRKLDRSVQRKIDLWLTKHVDGSENPRAFGKGLSANRTGYWRYRIGDYRVICRIYDDVLEIIAVHAGHRSNVYG